MTNYGADYLRRLVTALDGFNIAFDAWMETQSTTDRSIMPGILPTVFTKEGTDPATVEQLALAVAEKAGLAARAISVTGTYIVVQGYGPLDPIANWSLMSSPKAFFTPFDIRTSAANARGRLLAMIEEAESSASGALPVFSPAALHPVVWAAAAEQWTIHRYRIAVREATEALTSHWKQRLGRTDTQATPFWQQTLSTSEPKPGEPRLSWPDTGDLLTDKGMREGLSELTKSLKGLTVGINLTVRNPATHETAEYDEQDAMERLAAVSLIARLLDKCEVKRHRDDPNNETGNQNDGR